MATKKGLGMGMGELFGTPKANVTRAKAQSAEVKEEQTLEIDINEISPNKEQPRKKFDEDALLELSETIKIHGIIEPLVVTKRNDQNGKKYYQIIAGERRWRAAKMADLKTVPAVIKEFDDDQILEIALIENIQRENLNPIEEAQAFQELMKRCNLTQDQLAERVAKSRTAITNTVRLLKLAKKVQQMVIDEKLSAGHVRTLLAIEDKNTQYEMAQNIFDQKLSVRETEKKVKQYLEGLEQQKISVQELNGEIEKENNQKEAIAKAYQQRENEIKDHLKAKVNIQDKGNKGKIVISYDNLEEFERIFDLIIAN